MTELQRNEQPLARAGTNVVHDTIGRSFLALGGGEAAARIIAFGAVLVVAQRLGPEGLGVVSFSLAVMLYVSRVVDAGFDMGIGIREAAARRETLGDFVPPVLAFRLLLAFAVIVIGAPLAFAILPSAEGRITALYMATLIPLALSTRWVMTGLDRTSTSGIARATGELVVFISVLLVVRSSTDLWRMPVAQFVGDMVAAIIVGAGLVRLGIRFAVRWNGAVITPLLVRHVTPYVGSTLLGIVLFNADILFLRLYRDAATVGLYSSAYALLSFLLNIGGMYALTLIPALTRLASDHATRQDVYVQATGKVLLAVAPIAVGGGMIASGIMQQLYGVEFAAAAPVLIVLLASAPISVLRSVATSVLMAERREDYLLQTVTVSAAINVALNLVAVRVWGMMGAAVVTLTTELVRLGLAMRLASRTGYAAPPISIARKPLAAAIVMALVLLTPVGRTPWTAIPAGAAVYGAVLVALGALRFRRGTLPELVA
jgi:O-antigen/teichoic acid export membrane protein